MRSFATILLALSLPLHAFAAHEINHRRHAEIALRPRQDEHTNVRLTFYDITTGLTACGGSYTDDAFVVALNADQFGNTPGSSPFCGQTITITYNGKSTSAQIVDKCPGCPFGGLDLTGGLFKFFAPESEGVIYGSWSGGGGAAPKAPSPSSTPPPPSPTTHYEPPTTSQQPTSSPPPSSSSTSSTSNISSSVSSAAPTTHQPSSTPSTTQTSSAANYNNVAASSVAQPAGTVSPGQNQSINNMYQAMIGLGSIVEALNP